MKVLAILSLLAMGAMAAVERDGDIYNMFDAKHILDNNEMMSKLLDCMLDKAPCGDFQPIRDTAPRLIKSNCADCTPGQKAHHEEVMKIFEDNYNDGYKQIIAKYVTG